MAVNVSKKGGSKGSAADVKVEGFTKLRRAISKIDKGLGKRVTAALRLLGKTEVKPNVQEEARRFADTGTLEKSVRYSVTAKGASVYSNLPYAPVHEFGGTVAPRGVPIDIPRREWMNTGVRKSRREIDESIDTLIDFISDEWSSR